MNLQEFIDWHQRAYEVRVDITRLRTSAAFIRGYATTAMKGNELLTRCADDFMVAVKMLAKLEELADRERTKMERLGTGYEHGAEEFIRRVKVPIQKDRGADMLPYGYRYLEDGEVLLHGDLTFGKLSDGKFGWGPIPEYLHNQAWCEGVVGCNHPFIVVRQLAEKL